jgi:hypothetical protein
MRRCRVPQVPDEPSQRLAFLEEARPLYQEQEAPLIQFFRIRLLPGLPSTFFSLSPATFDVVLPSLAGRGVGNSFGNNAF